MNFNLDTRLSMIVEEHSNESLLTERSGNRRSSKLDQGFIRHYFKDKRTNKWRYVYKKTSERPKFDSTKFWYMGSAGNSKSYKRK